MSDLGKRTLSLRAMMLTVLTCLTVMLLYARHTGWSLMKLKNAVVICMPGQLRECSGNARIMFPTVPRSGSTLTRILLENATGIATEAVYKEDGAFDKRTMANARPCGILGNCETVRRGRGEEVAIVKTHFPFLGPELEPDACVSAVLMSVRHPLDNYLAWAHYQSGITEGRNYHTYNNSMHDELVLLRTRERMENFEAFGKKWESHIAFWHHFALSRNIPLLEYRYEDLTADAPFALKKILAFVHGDSVGVCPSAGSSSINGPIMLSNLKKPKSWGMITQGEVENGLAVRKDILVRLRYPSSWIEIMDLVGRLSYQMKN